MRNFFRFVAGSTAAFVLVSAPPLRAATHKPHAHAPAAPAIDYSAFNVGGLTFTMPPKWVAVVAETPARAGQWRILPPRGTTGDAGQLVAFFFGAGKGGSAKQSTDAWIASMFDAAGHPAAAEVKTHKAASGTVSQVIVFGTYSQPVLLPGIPPISKPDYGLIGTVVENPQGNIYWRFTGPQPLIAANLQLFDKMIDSVRPQGH